MIASDFIEKFKRTMLEHGIAPPLELIADGCHHHFKTEKGDAAFYGISEGLTKVDAVFWRGWTGDFGIGSTMVQIHTLVNFDNKEGAQCQ